MNAFLGEASTALKTAEHLYTVTYPLAHDTRILVSILGNIHRAQKACVAAFLLRANKHVDNYDEALVVLTKAYGNGAVSVLHEIHAIMELHQKCPIEFVKKDRFILCNDRYDIQIISSREIEQYLNKTREFIEKLSLYPAP